MPKAADKHGHAHIKIANYKKCFLDKTTPHLESHERNGPSNYTIEIQTAMSKLSYLSLPEP